MEVSEKFKVSDNHSYSISEVKKIKWLSESVSVYLIGIRQYELILRRKN